jgi:streptogramin lyase
MVSKIILLPMKRFFQVGISALVVLLSACNITPMPEPVIANTAIAGQLANWTQGTRLLKADVPLGSSGTFFALAKANLDPSGKFQMALPNTVQNEQSLYSLDGLSCLNISSRNVKFRDFYGLQSFHGIGVATGIVALGTEQRLYGWMYVTSDVSVSGNCSVSSGSISFSLNLKAGWNQVALEVPNDTTIRYTTAAISADATWQYISRVKETFIASPVGVFKIGEPIQLRVLDKNENEIKGVKWNNSDPTVAPVSQDGVVTPIRLGSFTVSGTLPTGEYVQVFDRLYTYGLEFSAGTYISDGTKGTAFYAQYRDENLMPTQQDLTLSVQGPAGWNATPQSLTIPASKLWSEKLLVTPPVSGEYTAQGSVTPNSGHQQISLGALEQRSRAILTKQNSSLQVTDQLRPQGTSTISKSFTMNANQVIPNPTVRWSNLTTTGFDAAYSIPQNLGYSVTMFFDLHDTANGQVVATSLPQLSLSSNVQFRDLNLNQSKVYQLDAVGRNIYLSVDDAKREIAYVNGQYNVYKSTLPVVFTPVIQALSATGAAQVGGTKLTIDGANFTADTSVSFGDTPVTAKTLVSETKMDVLVPTSNTLGTVDITLSNPRGSSVSSPQSKFEYIKVTEFTLPDNPNSSPEILGKIQPDTQGRVWFYRSGQIGFVNHLGQFTIFSLPHDLGVYSVNDMDVTSNEAWFTDGDKLVKVTDSGTFSAYQMGNSTFGSSNEVTIGHDGAVWVSDSGKNAITRFDTNGNRLNTLSATVNVRNLVRGPDQSMWFIANESFGSTGQVGKIDAAGQVNVFTPVGAESISSIIDLIPAGEKLYYRAIMATQSLIGQIQADTTGSLFETNLAIGVVAFGLDNHFWYTRQNLGATQEENILVRFTLSREAKSYLVAPRMTNYYEGINQIVSTPGLIWFTRANVNKISVITVNP